MKKSNKRIIIIIAIVLAVIIVGALIAYFTLHDESKLSVEEKEWITANLNRVHNVNVINNVDVFGKNGSGVFYDFIADFEKEYGLDINLITYNYGEDISDKSFQITYNISDNDTVFYKEHYVIISNSKESLTNIRNINRKKIGILSADTSIINKYLQNNVEAELISYETISSLFDALNANNEIEYAIIPLEENLTSILTANYYINYHISDLNKYFIFKERKDDSLSSIVKKYFAIWEEKKLAESINKNKLNTFTQALSITDKDLATIQGKTYEYGFINNHPYEVLISGSYGGIVSEYIASFSAFSNTEFKFTNYKNFNKLTEAITNKKIDLYFNYYNIETNYHELNSLNNVHFVVIAEEKNNAIIRNVTSLTDQEVYIAKNTILEKYISSLGGVKINTYETEAELKKIANKNALIIIDKDTYDYYKKSILSNYSVRYENYLSSTYNFYAKNNDTFNVLFNKYIQTLDPEEIRIKGIYNHSETVKSGTIIGKIAKYSLIIIGIIIVLTLYLYKSTKKIKIAKKIKKEDKLKYIDQLTSLKNRNYLNENIDNWNKNTIYPQATIIVDLNHVKAINDQLGYEQGDAQIKSAANVLIKTQLDNTDIMRTSGNEYLIYLVGYQEKQVVSYIRKLYKEFKNLPYEHGATIGYSMIENDMKTIEDAINEAVEDMRTKKEELEEE